MYAKIIPFPILCTYMSVVNPAGWLLVALYFAVDKKLTRQTVEEYTVLHGGWMTAMGAMGLLLSILWPTHSLWIALMLLGASAGFMIYDRYRVKRRPLLYQVREDGLCVLYVQPGSAAQTMGLKSGDQVRQVNGQKIMNAEAVQVMLDEAKPLIWMDVERGDQKLTLEYQDYTEGIHYLGVVFVPRHPTKFHLKESRSWLI